MQAAASTSQVLLMCSPRFSAMAARQNAATTATAAQATKLRNLFKPREASADTDVPWGIQNFFRPRSVGSVWPPLRSATPWIGFQLASMAPMYRALAQESPIRMTEYARCAYHRLRN